MFGLGERKERRAALLAKAEDATSAFATWVNTLQSWPRAHYDLFLAGQRQRADANIEEIWERANAEAIRAKMLIHVYLPLHTGVLSAVSQALRPFIDKGRDAKLEALKGAAAPAWLAQEIGAAQIRILDAGTAGLNELYGATRNLAHAPFLVRLPVPRAISRPVAWIKAKLA